MKALIDVVATAEQLALFSRVIPGVVVIRGAAGSGKTTTAILKLRAAVGFFINRMRRQPDKRPVKVLVLTFNRTLRGYVTELAEKQFEQGSAISLEISTFSSWALGLLGKPKIIDAELGESKIRQLSKHLDLDFDFIKEETDYVLGRFLTNSLDEYLTTRRDGRGVKPRMERKMREALLNEVIRPYAEFKLANHLVDWNDLAVTLTEAQHVAYDVVVVDETQDFSANEIRAVMNQLEKEHTVTFVLDTAQRIYARTFTWQEAGVTVRPEASHRLTVNYRNTKQIARFAAGVLAGIAPDDDGSMPNFESATREGAMPIVLKGKFFPQLSYSINQIKKHIDLRTESVAFLHPKGGGWFKEIRLALEKERLAFVELSRKSDWPQGSENIALCTLHSAKGLEFDHVFILGLNGEVTAAADDELKPEDDERLTNLRRLVAMGIGRARNTVVVGYKPADASAVCDFFDENTCTYVTV